MAVSGWSTCGRCHLSVPDYLLPTGHVCDPCSCEHVRHFPDADDFPDEPRDGHPYGQVPADSSLGTTIVGTVCKWCADHCGVFEASAAWRAVLGWDAHTSPTSTPF